MARQANQELLALPESSEELDTGAILGTISAALSSEEEPTRLAALHWIQTLLGRCRPQVRSVPFLCSMTFACRFFGFFFCFPP